MRIYNSATHKKEEFQPIESGKVRMYVCGPTVYDNIHIGNARTFISFDVIRRWLIASGYEVTFAQNLTDVDDKIIKRANEQGRTAAEVATDVFSSTAQIASAIWFVVWTRAPRISSGRGRDGVLRQVHRRHARCQRARSRCASPRHQGDWPHDRHDQDAYRAGPRLRSR